MEPLTAKSYPSPEADDAAAFRRLTPADRPPRPVDYLLYFFGIPISLAIIFSMVGIRLTYGMPYMDALVYMVAHMFVAWWSVNLGAAVIKFSFRSWRPPTFSICILGVLISLIPAAFLFMRLGDFYASVYPVFAVNRADNILPSWTLAYLVHFIRYSLPILPTFLAGVYGYRYVMGVDWFGYPPETGRAAAPRNSGHGANPQVAQALSPQTVSEPATLTTRQATAELVAGTKLPDSARLIAVKAEQHYIKIWSDQGTDLVRYRFKDLLESLGDYKGTQVHRSWWVDLDRVRSWRKAGRKIELLVELDSTSKPDESLVVPVSMSHKESVVQALKRNG